MDAGPMGHVSLAATNPGWSFLEESYLPDMTMHGALQGRTICFVSHSAGTGGAERVLLETIEVLSDQGVKCRVLLPEAGDLCDELTKLGVPFRIIRYGFWMSRGKQSRWMAVKSLVRHLATLPAILWTIKRWNSDIVYTNTITVCTGAIASMMLRRPHVWHIHEFGYEDHGLVFFFGEYLSYKIMDLSSSACPVVSEALKMKYEWHVASSKLTVIYPAIQQARWGHVPPNSLEVCVPARRERFRAIIIGTLIEGKGQAEAIEAIAELAGRGLRVELLVVGNGVPEYMGHLGKLIKSFRLGDLVHLIGHVKNPLPFLESSDVALVCSRREAFGRVTIEAMLAGRPVIGARRGATPELVEDGVNGLLYEPGNCSELADKIQFLCENPAVALRLGEAGMEWATATFTREQYGNQLLSVLNALIDSRSKRWEKGFV